ncbi:MULTISPECIES: DNA-3-methyladenine glycosylase I [Sphingobacterium]|jgi:DNA-3-methyladenine glycosylase I|uniref:DNA-3-methyladenine glycosylase I n=1 Tax=Sphingobacterium TaxID=28453 RepID=UPI00040D1C29|nr:DNA-3-methyladenine glycosylase I [Sphingobacterium sp. IITKGP-BTPF85]KKX47877.1 DNA-3-methyladenine glycosylase [Sphingobacterium sp. IITKGP-BTPF85]
MSTTRCLWCGNDPLYMEYHDLEWGKQVKDDKTLFEFMILESAQAGLSWITILKRRPQYKEAFADFDVQAVAKFTPEDVEHILTNTGVVRHRRKIETSITNAQIFIKIQEEFGSFYEYLYQFMPNRERIENNILTQKDTAVTSLESDLISKDLKKRGVKFFGSTICYAYMQAVGMVNDHLYSCTFRN